MAVDVRSKEIVFPGVPISTRPETLKYSVKLNSVDNEDTKNC